MRHFIIKIIDPGYINLLGIKHDSYFIAQSLLFGSVFYPNLVLVASLTTPILLYMEDFSWPFMRHIKSEFALIFRGLYPEMNVKTLVPSSTAVVYLDIFNSNIFN